MSATAAAVKLPVPCHETLSSPQTAPALRPAYHPVQVATGAGGGEALIAKSAASAGVPTSKPAATKAKTEFFTSVPSNLARAPYRTIMQEASSACCRQATVYKESNVLQRHARGLTVHPLRRGAEQEPGDGTGRQRAAKRRQYFFEPGVAAVLAVVLKGGRDGWSRLGVGGRVLIAAQARLGRSG